MYVVGASRTPGGLGLLAQPAQPAPVVPPPALGTFARARHEIDQIVNNAAEAQRWSLAGSLLANGNYRLRIEHPAPAPNNRFRRGTFQRHNKCNLFALDIAWRSGFRVPLINRRTPANPQYSYPRSNSMTTYAERAIASGAPRLRGLNGDPWGAPQSRVLYPVINFAIRGLGALVIVVGWRRSGVGHVGIIDQIREIRYDNAHRITRISYDGWEATGDRGAIRVAPPRRWQTTNCGPLTGVCRTTPGNPLRVFCRIHLISLLPEPTPANRGVLVDIPNRCRL